MPDIVGGLTITNLPADPATGAKQSDGNTLLTAIAASVDGLEASIGLPSDAPASSELQSAGTLGVLRGIWVELREIGEWLANFLRAQQSPPWLDWTNNALRINLVTGATVTTVTTVSTLSDQTNIGAMNAKTAYTDYAMHNAWNNALRARITT